MTQSDNRTYFLLNEVNNLLCKIDCGTDTDNDVKKVSHALRWINENLDRTLLLEFIDTRCNDLQYSNIIKELLNKSLFRTNWKIIN